MHRPMLVLLAALALAGCATATTAPTVEPTEEIVATAAAVVEPTEDGRMAVANYVLWTGETVGRAQDALSAVSTAVRPAGADPSLLDDSEWLTSTGRELGKMVAVARDIEAFDDVPDEARDLHAEMLTYAAHLSTAAKLLAAGLDDKDIKKITAGATIMSQDMPATIDRMTVERDKILPPGQ